MPEYARVSGEVEAGANRLALADDEGVGRLLHPTHLAAALLDVAAVCLLAAAATWALGGSVPFWSAAGWLRSPTMGLLWR